MEMRCNKKWLLLLLLLPLTLSIELNAQQNTLLERSAPEQVGLNRFVLQRADRVIEQAIEDRQIPGAVLAVVRHDKLAYLQAYGNKRTVPSVEPMEEETIFDLASLSKPLGAGIAIMQLLERGEILLQDRVQRYLPDWSEDDRITIRHLLTHTSGLPAYAPVQQVLNSDTTISPPARLYHYIANCERGSEPGETMRYSCLNFVTLQYIVEKVTGMSLSEYTTENIYRPMGLQNTGFLPPKEKYAQIAPTEVQEDGEALLGEVHDPLARRLNLGNSGNAGLFSTAEEVAAIATMLLNGGKFHGVQLLSPATVRAFTTIPRGYEEFGRTLGWDSYSTYSSNLGNLTSRLVHGHTGYTGTSICIDPQEDMAVVLLTNRVHPKDSTSTIRLNAIVTNIVSAAADSEEQLQRFSRCYSERFNAFAAEEPITPDDIVMYGNSLTEGGREWNRYFPKLKQRIVNRGISGDSSYGLLYRSDEIVTGQPGKLFIMIGINDIADGIPIEEVATNICYLTEYIGRMSPDTKIYLQSLLPVNESYNRYRGLTGRSEEVAKLNSLIKEIAEEQPNITYIELHDHFLDKKSNALRRDLTNDGLHLNKKGYKLWAKLLRPYL